MADATTVELPHAIAVLRGLEQSTGVLSAYLDTAPERIAGEAVLMSFVDCVGAERHRVERVAPAAVSRRFEQAVARVGRFLSEEWSPSSPGLALFAEDEAGYFVVVPLPSRPEESVIWDATPRLGPLQAALDEFARVAVLLFDKEKARIFTVFLGALEEQQRIFEEVPGKQATGGWFGLAQARYARHHEDHVLRHAQHASIAMMELLARKPFDRLFLAGPDEALALLKQVLPTPLQKRVVGVLALEMFAPAAEILDRALTAAEQVERRYEALEVAELIEAATSPHVALGIDETLSALGDGRLHLVFVGSRFAAAGGICTSCGRLAPPNPRCLWCDGPISPRDDLRDSIFERVVAQGARIEFVAGAAEDALIKVGNIGAWTRY